MSDEPKKPHPAKKTDKNKPCIEKMTLTIEKDFSGPPEARSHTLLGRPLPPITVQCWNVTTESNMTTENCTNNISDYKNGDTQSLGIEHMATEFEQSKEKNANHTQTPKEEDSAKNTNRFAAGKNFIQTIADVSLMMANFSQLRAVLDFDEHNHFYVSLPTLIIISLLSHIIFVIIIVMRTNFHNRHLVTVSRAGKEILLGNKDVNRNIRYFMCCTKKERLEEYIDNDLCQCRYCHTNRYLNYICMILVFITICANIGITGIGISE